MFITVFAGNIVDVNLHKVIHSTNRDIVVCLG